MSGFYSPHLLASVCVLFFSLFCSLFCLLVFSCCSPARLCVLACHAHLHLFAVSHSCSHSCPSAPSALIPSAVGQCALFMPNQVFLGFSYVSSYSSLVFCKLCCYCSISFFYLFFVVFLFAFLGSIP